MSMFCYQCQETLNNSGCVRAGVCGKSETVANIQDLLVHVLKGIALAAEPAGPDGASTAGPFVTDSLFATITNANFDQASFVERITRGIALRDSLKKKYPPAGEAAAHDALTWSPAGEGEYAAKGAAVGVLATENEDVRSLRELLVYGLKGIAAYAHHAAVLGYEEEGIYSFMLEALRSTVRALTAEEMTAMVLRAGEWAVTTMALLDRANTGTYGDPVITRVPIGVRKNPGILVSGHDLKDLEELLKQTEGSGVDVYTHSEMLPAHYYPAFRKFAHFAGNYGGSWWKQRDEFESFNGPILMTTNCITPVKESYRDRIFTTGVTGFAGVAHVPDRPEGGSKDFSTIIELAKKCPPPEEIETGEIVGGFAHGQVFALADTVVAAVKSGAIRKFIVMAGCDGRKSERDYYTKVAEKLPGDTVILTAGCAKYRYNKLGLGEIGGIPRVLDAGQCNDSYSLALIALKLKEVFGLEDINDLPIAYDIAWYEQKAVAVLLALLYLGVKGIRLGPTVPAFLSPGVLGVLVERFGIRPIGGADEDIADMLRA